jgi:O-antigen ligase
MLRRRRQPSLAAALPNRPEVRRQQSTPFQNSTLSIIWFALGLVLTTATQLRGASSVGVGELLLVSWVTMSLFALAAQRQIDPSTLVKALLVFWIVALTVLALGLIVSSAPLDRSSVDHDGRAILFVAAVVLSFVAPNGTLVRFRRTLLFTLSFSLVPLLFLWFVGLFVSTFGPLELWYGPRFVGWTENPNQLALLTAPAPFLCFYLASTLSGKAKYWSVFLGFVAVLLGLASYSDALRVCWFITALFLLLARWFRVVVQASTSRQPPSIAYLIGSLAAAIIVVGAGLLLASRVEDATAEMYQEGDQGAVRLTSWRFGIDAMAKSPVFGSGPGTHARAPMSLEPIEAHNTFIDWASNTGLVGLSAYILLLGWIGTVLLRSGQMALLAALLALTSFSIFNYVLRQPVYWFFLLAPVAISVPPAHGRTPTRCEVSAA